MKFQAMSLSGYSFNLCGTWKQITSMTSSTAQAVAFITFVQDLKRKGEWTVFNELLKQKNLTIQDQLARLQMKIVAEDKVVRSKIKTLLNDWEKEKPISRELQPDIAINPINLFETCVNWLQEEKRRFHQKSVALVRGLKSDALRERHWKMFYKNLRLSGHYSPLQMTLGTIWDMDLKKNESLIRQVLAQATGEVALEEYIRQMSEIFDKWIDQVFKSPYVLDVLQIPEVLKTLDKLVESLSKLQKALGEYL
ncbi:hypothetical protein PPACK8108_LOCUS22921 [Phakopsora pachyrhizi]|uniref:Dynein heavy chain linker domain-containing protein n=1 Tax=Phakopsora pachyrhizi TaxID=170000 RepID=A0AAV0BNU4_PHAPC|nr:hypothetical protein PPACK8108_LOCUS22921 [Phakopsora pachyrhizi]